MLANKRREAAQLSSPDDSFASVSLKIFVGNTMLNIEHSGASVAHYQIIRRMRAQPAAQVVGAPTLCAGPSAFSSPVGAALCLIPARLRAMVQALAGVAASCRCSAQPGRTQEPPRPLVPPRWGSVIAMAAAEGGAA